jgi:hypothetical protein
MKKILFATLLLSASFGLLGSCSKGEDEVTNKCDVGAKKVSDAGNAFSADPNNKSKCQVYISAINEMYKTCPAYYPAATKKILDNVLSNACLPKSSGNNCDYTDNLNKQTSALEAYQRGLITCKQYISTARALINICPDYHLSLGLKPLIDQLESLTNCK